MYSSVSAEMIAIDSTSPVPIAIPTTIDTANTRTPSAAARVSRNSPAVTLCSACPNLRSISWYAVIISPWKYFGRNSSATTTRPIM